MINILYAEDNPDDVVILKLALKRAALPHSLLCVDDGESAIAWLRGEEDFANRQEHPLPDLLILDSKMPKKSGFDVLEWMKKTKEFELLPVIILSSSDDPRDVKRANDLGTARYFMKSASCQNIIQHLKSI